MTDETQNELRAARGEVEALARGIHESAARLRAEWGAALNEMTREAASVLDGMAGGAGYAGAAGSLGELIGLANGDGRQSTVKYAHPAITRPAGTNVTLAPGAIQITTQTLDERTLDTVAARLADKVRARIAFDDGRYGQS